MPPFWKVKREFLRVWFKVYDRVTAPVDRLVQMRYDAGFGKSTELLAGRVAPSDRMAILFIYQPGAVGRSVRHTCQYLRDKGYSVLLVSSTLLDASARSDLSEVCWKILLRPNYGYDFGGYRDGLRVLREASLRPERLLILNDSVWFPIVESTRLLETLESENLAFNSPVFVNIRERKPQNRHFQSFFFLLRREALEHPAFTEYWRRYRVSSNKRVVLRHGEKGFSQAMFRGGFGGSAPATKDDLLTLLSAQTSDFLYKSLYYAAYAQRDLVAEGRALMESFADTPDWRTRTLSHMQRAIAKYSPLGVFVYASIRLLDFSFLKKRSYSDVFDGMRWQYMRAVSNGDLPAPHPDVLAEIRNSDMDGTLTAQHPALRHGPVAVQA